MWRAKNKQLGFTIVELLIVVVVIAILAAITIVAYASIRDRAELSSLASALSQADKKLRTYAIKNGGVYPSDLSEIGFSSGGDQTYTYRVDNSLTPAYYCISVKVGNAPAQFLSSSNERVASGSCDGLVGWWQFNGSTQDSGPFRYPSTGGGFSPSIGQNSVSGGYQFTAGYMQVSGFDHNVLRAANGGQSASWSMSAWAQALSTSQNNESKIVGRAGCHGGLYTYSNQYRLAIKSNNTSNCWTGSLEVGSFAIDTSWRHIVGTYEAGQMSIYVDGALVQTGTFTATMYSYGDELRIGGSSGRVFNGRIDDVRIYTRALNQQEVLDLFSKGAY